ncbi:MAG: Ig-like domain-containing protein [Desulfitobacteriaceae bacterium]|nr:Ig-like domain-containing protein [Desulfitobacteriaceae bacterium]
MPYIRADSARPVAVEKVELTLAVNKRTVKVGEGLTFSGRLTRNGVGYGGQEVTVQYRRYVEEWKVLGRALTDAYGNFMLGHAFTYEEGCHDVEVRAYWTPSPNVLSGSVYVAVAYPTRISVEAPDTVTPGEVFTVSGTLEYEMTSSAWYGLPDQTVTVYFNGKVFGTATTGARGNYEVSGSIAAPGSYTLKAVFEGSGAPPFFARSFALLAIPREWAVPEWAKTVFDMALAFSPLIAAGATIAYDAFSRGVKWP